MSKPVQPRFPSQIEELTKRIMLPLPPIGREHIEVILETIQGAFEGLLQEYGATLRDGDEAEVNSLVASRLCALLADADPARVDEQPPWQVLWRQLVNAVARGAETTIYDAGHLEKRPDLNIFLTRRHPAFPLVGECKLIDARNGKTVTLYHEKGIARFLEGEYGWATQEALMVAYVRDVSSITSALMPSLSQVGRAAPHSAYQFSLPLDPSLDLALSVYERRFRYVGRPTPKDEPGRISIWHLWMPVTPAC